MEKLKAVIAEGRDQEATKKNPQLYETEKSLKNLTDDLSKTLGEVGGHLNSYEKQGLMLTFSSTGLQQSSGLNM